MVSMNWGEEKYDGTRYPGAQVLQVCTHVCIQLKVLVASRGSVIHTCKNQGTIFFFFIDFPPKPWPILGASS